jgi:hypothetical protein
MPSRFRVIGLGVKWDYRTVDCGDVKKNTFYTQEQSIFLLGLPTAYY